MRSPIAIIRDDALIFIWAAFVFFGKDTAKARDKESILSVTPQCRHTDISKGKKKNTVKHLVVSAFIAIFVADKGIVQ